ncbi:MAG: RagB/SusD family nutrient uptake outer membrane protein [Breznakibacter sp.]
MKKHIISFALAAGLFWGCSDDFLKEEMVSTITQDYFKTEKGLEELIVASYNTLRFKHGFMEGPYLFETGNDILEPTVNSWAIFSPAVWSASGEAGSYANNLMGYYATQLLGGYPHINDCNKAIEIIKNIAPGKFGTDAGYAGYRLSEVYFLRAWTYYMLVTQLGDVPLKLESNNTVSSVYYFPRATSEEIYKQLISDLRFAYEHLPLPGEVARGRVTKWAAAHFLAKLYLQRAQATGFKQYRNGDGSIDHDNASAHLGMLYKGEGTNDLDSVIHYTSEIISAYGGLSSDYWDLFKTGIGDWSNEENAEIILQASYGKNLDNGRYGMRTNAAFTCDYTNATWNIPSKTWAYGLRKGTGFLSTDWGYDVFTDKINDSRFEKSFQIEYESASFDNTTLTDGPGIAYNDASNKSQAWETADANFFNTYIHSVYNRESWGGRNAVVKEHKIGKGDLGLVFLENTKETAIDSLEAVAQPYVLYPRWIKANGKYYYRKTGVDKLKSNTGLLIGRTIRPSSRKFIDPNRSTVDNHFGTRDVAIFRLAETYLLRAEAYGRKGDYANAVNDINVLRYRASYKAGETRAEVLARLYPGAENLVTSERQYPYTVASGAYERIKVDESYWDGASENRCWKITRPRPRPVSNGSSISYTMKCRVNLIPNR